MGNCGNKKRRRECSLSYRNKILRKELRESDNESTSHYYDLWSTTVLLIKYDFWLLYGHW